MVQSKDVETSNDSIVMLRLNEGIDRLAMANSAR